MAVSKDETKQGNNTPRGQATKYKEEYDQMLIEHLEGGLSFESFAGVVSVDRDTIYNWCKLFPNFSDAKKLGMQKCRLWWEKAGRSGMFMGGKDNPFNSAIWIYNMKCRFRNEWTEKQIIEETSTRSISDADKALMSEYVEKSVEFFKGKKK